MKLLIYKIIRTGARTFAATGFALLIAGSAIGQTAEQQITEPVAARQPKSASVRNPSAPMVADLKGVKIGMTADEVEKVLGNADSKDATSMYFDLKNGESMQMQLDADKKVSMMAAIYTGSNAKAPEMTAVLGPDAAMEPGEDGRIYKLVRYPAAGYWVAYSRINAGGNPMTTVTITKMN